MNTKSIQCFFFGHSDLLGKDSSWIVSFLYVWGKFACRRWKRMPIVRYPDCLFWGGLLWHAQIVLSLLLTHLVYQPIRGDFVPMHDAAFDGHFCRFRIRVVLAASRTNGRLWSMIKRNQGKCTECNVPMDLVSDPRNGFNQSLLSLYVFLRNHCMWLSLFSFFKRTVNWNGMV